MIDRDASGENAGAAPAADPETADLRELLADLEDLGESVTGRDAREALAATEASLLRAGGDGLVAPGVRRLDLRDAAEAFIGCVVFASPLLVEDGIFDIATHLFDTTVAGVPVYLFLNTAFVVLMTYALVEWTGRDTVEVSPLLDVVPGRVLMVLVVSVVVSAVLMTVWGRVDWQQPTAALARITVLWAVGSLGAALGDILASDDRSNAAAVPEVVDVDVAAEVDGRGTTADDQPLAAVPDAELVAELRARFDHLEAHVDADQQRDLDRIETATEAALVDDRFGDRIRKYTGRDIAEAFVGSVFFSIPFLVEDGVFDVAAYFLSFRLGAFPVFFVLNAAFVLAIVYGLVYWAGPQDVVVTRPIVGFVPRRLVGSTVVAFLTAALLMTMWGRVGWTNLETTVARISVVWTVASFGAALGDVLPGESSGDDVYDDIADLGDQVEEFVEELG